MLSNLKLLGSAAGPKELPAGCEACPPLFLGYFVLSGHLIPDCPPWMLLTHQKRWGQGKLWFVALAQASRSPPQPSINSWLLTAFLPP